jgi:hypothetical protein
VSSVGRHYSTVLLRSARFSSGMPNQCIDEARRVFEFKRDRVRVPITCHLE